jgi:hypothetical protein
LALLTAKTTTLPQNDDGKIALLPQNDNFPPYQSRFTNNME